MARIYHQGDNFYAELEVAEERAEEAENLLNAGVRCWFGDEEEMAEHFPDLYPDAFYNIDCGWLEPSEELLENAGIEYEIVKAGAWDELDDEEE